ncbi:MAG: hypothetical protein QXX12_03015 [Nanopusillaceae archaeon]
MSVYITYRDDRIRVYRTYRDKKIYVYITYRDSLLVSLIVDTSHRKLKNNRRKTNDNSCVNNNDTYKQRHDI